MTKHDASRVKLSSRRTRNTDRRPEEHVTEQPDEEQRTCGERRREQNHVVQRVCGGREVHVDLSINTSISVTQGCEPLNTVHNTILVSLPVSAPSAVPDTNHEVRREVAEGDARNQLHPEVKQTGSLQHKHVTCCPGGLHDKRAPRSHTRVPISPHKSNSVTHQPIIFTGSKQSCARTHVHAHAHVARVVEAGREKARLSHQEA